MNSRQWIVSLPVFVWLIDKGQIYSRLHLA